VNGAGARHRRERDRRPLWLILALAAAVQGASGQEPEIKRPPPPSLEDFEADANRDGVPDGWYNLRDA
jgi:hypothetical protein